MHRTAHVTSGATLPQRSWWRTVLDRLSLFVVFLILRVSDFVVLIFRPRLMRAYVRLWLTDLRRSPYPYPQTFDAQLACKRADQTDRELVYGETPIATGVWLLWRAGLRRGDRFLDLLAGRGSALLGARWLGAEAQGVELLSDHVVPTANILASVEADLRVGNALDTPLDGAQWIYLTWTTLRLTTVRRVIDHLKTCAPETRIISVDRPIEDPSFTIVSRYHGLFPWGLRPVFVQRKSASGAGTGALESSA